MAANEWVQAILHCPNCGSIVTGYRDKEGYAKIQCLTCQVNIVSKRISRRHERIDLYAPQGQVAVK